MTRLSLLSGGALSACLASFLSLTAPALAWAPDKTVEIVVPAGPGGASDRLGRTIQAVLQEQNLIGQPITVSNKGGANSAEGLLDVANAGDDPHKLLIALSNLFVVPNSTDLDFHWTKLKPVAILAFDEFVLWVKTDSPHQTAADLIAAAKTSPGTLRIGGTQARNDDHLLTFAMEKATGAKFTFIPYKSGGEVATQLVGGHIDANVNNPGENVSQWRAGEVRPLCVFSNQPIPYTDKVTETMAWSDIPLCRDQGLDIPFRVLRGVFLPAGVDDAELAFHVEALRKMSATPAWTEYLKANALTGAFLTGAEAEALLKADEERYTGLMREAGFLHASRQ